MTFLGSLRQHFIGRVATLGIATFLSALLSLALLPIATTQLHAADYGTYALLMSLVALISSAMDGGSSLFLPAVYSQASLSERGRIFTTAAVMAGGGGIAISALLIVVAQYFHPAHLDSSIPLDAIIIAAVLVPLRSIAVITTIILSVTNRGPVIALQTIVQASSVFVFTIAALFWLSLGGTALVFGAACGQFSALVVGLVALYQHGELHPYPSRRWARRSLSHTLTSSTLGFAGGAHSFAENALLTAASGLPAAGLLNHARLYYNFTMSLVATVGHNIRATSLGEAHSSGSNFNATRKAWTPVHMALTCAGLLFALFGGYIVDYISNGKLVGAAPYIPFFIIIILIQNSGQASTAVVYATGNAHVAARSQIIITLLGLVALYPFVNSFGIAGIASAIIAETILYRLKIEYLANRLRKIPFQDAIGYFGCMLIAATALWVDGTTPTAEARLIWMIGALILVAFVGRRSIAETIAEIAYVAKLTSTMNRNV